MVLGVLRIVWYALWNPPGEQGNVDDNEYANVDIADEVAHSVSDLAEC